MEFIQGLHRTFVHVDDGFGVHQKQGDRRVGLVSQLLNPASEKVGVDGNQGAGKAIDQQPGSLLRPGIGFVGPGQHHYRRDKGLKALNHPHERGGQPLEDQAPDFGPHQTSFRVTGVSGFRSPQRRRPRPEQHPGGRNGDWIRISRQANYNVFNQGTGIRPQSLDVAY